MFCRLLPQDLTERLHRLQVERESLESKMEAEKHVMRAQLRDLMEKQRAEVQRLTEQHQAQMAQTQQELLGQLEELRRTSVSAQSTAQEACGGHRAPADGASVQRIAELEGWRTPVSPSRKMIDLISETFLFRSTSKAENRRSQQVRGQIPENEGVVQVQNQTVGGGVKEIPGRPRSSLTHQQTFLYQPTHGHRSVLTGL